MQKIFQKGVIQMKRKLDPNKIYAFIGRAVTFLTTIVLLNIANYHLAIYILDNCITVYRQEGGKKCLQEKIEK